MTLLPFSKNVNMAVGHQLFCEICQRLRSMTEKRKDLEQLNIEKTNSSTIFYVLSVAVVCVGFLSSWLSVSWRTPLSFGQQSSNEMLNFGERSLRFADVPYPKPSPTETEPVLLSGEAAAALHLAVKMNEDGKSSKALKLFQQALKLSPKNPNILNAYGEFLEKEELIEAENLYTRALINDPLHSQAMANRQRTFPQVQKLDQEMLERIDKKRFQLYEVPDENAALQRVMKEAYYRHIHHTTAMEGNTMTLSMARAVVETKMAIHGKSIKEHNEILGLDEALKYINATLIRETGSVTIESVIEIHKRVLGHAHPLEAGRFRNTQVFVGNHIPPHPTDVERFMKEFNTWLSSPVIRQLHPVEFAALAHYRLVYIHPFTDGNGRTARLLMNLILMRAGFPPVIIKVTERHKYYACLQDANHGDIRPFIRFIARCAERTIDEFLSATTIFPIKYSGQTLDYTNHLRQIDKLTLTK